VSGPRFAAVATAVIASLPTLAQAQAVAVGAATEAAARARAGEAVPPLAAPSLIGRELEDWQDPRTGTTAHLFDQCSMLMELRLTNHRSGNYLWMKLDNTGKAPVLVRPDLFKVRVGAHSWRHLYFHSGTGGPEIAPGKRAWLAFRFDDKAEFAGARTIDVELPLEGAREQECRIRAQMVRPARVPEDPVSSVAYWGTGIWMMGGIGLASTGGFDRLGGADWIIEIGFDFFLSLHHGFSLGLLGESYGSFERADFQGSVPASAEDLELGAGGFFAGYELRFHPKAWLPIAFGAALGPYGVSLEDRDEQYVQKTNLASLLRANADAIFLTGGNDIVLAIRLSSTALVVPAGDFGPIDLSGVRLGAMLGLVLAQ